MIDLSLRYIAFEGVEGAGKSTVARRIATHLESSGELVTFVREPGGTEVGERIRDILLGEGEAPSPRAEAALFAAARAQLVSNVVKPALEAGSWVLSDRTAYSSLAYQAIGRGLDLDEVRTLNNIAIDGLWPGTVVLLRLDADQGLKRQAVDDRIGGETAAFHRAVAEGFDLLASREPDRFTVVDATRSIGAVVEDVIARLDL